MYAKRPVIYVDVDGTIHTKGILNEQVIRYCAKMKSQGFRLVLWSARGAKYAREAAAHYEIMDLFENVLSKPGYTIDDQGWGWVKYTHVITLDEIVRFLRVAPLTGYRK